MKGLLKFFMYSRQIRSMKGRVNTMALAKNSQDSVLLSDPTSLPAGYCRVAHGTTLFSIYLRIICSRAIREAGCSRTGTGQRD